MTAVQRQFECPFTKGRCDRSDCKRGLCVLDLMEKRREQLLDAIEKNRQPEFEAEIYGIAESELFLRIGKRLKREDRVKLSGKIVPFDFAVTAYIKRYRARLEQEARARIATRQEIIRDAKTDGFSLVEARRISK